MKLEKIHFGTDQEECKGIPLKIVATAYQKLPRASPIKLMFGLLALTGCRIAELDRMRQDMIYGDVLHFFLGKKQRKQPRKVRLPAWYWSDYREMLINDPPRNGRLFPIESHSFRRYFLHARAYLGPEWNEKNIYYRDGQPLLEYRYQLKGLRKNYQTVRFTDNFNKYDDAGVALEFTSKEMRHSSKHTTIYHYIQEMDKLGLRKGQKPPENLLLPEEQTSLGEWL